ncbi:MAG: hypothetical protein HOJ58_03775 [Chloroflexi bacterium]|nr:hypothetical protein [Chloroflexota bacterium]
MSTFSYEVQNDAKFAGVYGYTHLAFIEYSNNFIYLNYGRSFIDIGNGKFSNLLVSNFSRPFDQMQISLNYRVLSLRSNVIQLESIEGSKRYLSLHTFEYSNNNLHILLGESVLIAGENRSFEIQYFNPMMMWLPEQVNVSTGSGNSMLFGSIKYSLSSSFSLWGELLIDDYQINREVKGDLEPNEIGFLGGVEKTGWPFVTSDLWLEYTRITNRTYQTPDLSETYTHRNFPIGHYLGNDFDMLQLYYSQENVNGKLKPYISLVYLRDGANGLDTPFDMPWEDSTVTMETGYTEPFPTGPITYVTEMELAADYKFSSDSFINAGLFFQRKTLLGKTEDNFSLIIRLWFSLDKTFIY